MRVLAEEHAPRQPYAHLSKPKHPLLKRAMTAFYRTPGGVGGKYPNHGYVVELDDGRRYVVLALGNGFERVYRVRAYDGVLKRLKRWPHELGQVGQPAKAAADSPLSRLVPWQV